MLRSLTENILIEEGSGSNPGGVEFYSCEVQILTRILKLKGNYNLGGAE